MPASRESVRLRQRRIKFSANYNTERVLEKLNTGAPAAGRDMESIINTAGTSEPRPVNEGSLNERMSSARVC